MDLFSHDLSSQGTLRAQGIDIHGDEGPFEMYVETGLGLLDGQRISNTVQLAASPSSGQGKPRFPGGPPVDPPGFKLPPPGLPMPRSPFGPRGRGQPG